MFGILKDVSEMIGKTIGTVCGIPLAALAITLGVSTDIIKSAVDAGCETKEEIEKFINDL